MDIEKYLLKRGISPALKGFDYIVKAVELIKEDIQYKFAVTRKLYPKIAEIYNDTPNRVERAIRHALSTAKVNYTNSEFIAIVEIETR